MSIFTRVYGSTADRNAQSSTTSTYLTARAATFSSNSAAATSGICGQVFATPNYTVYQAFFQFDLSAVSGPTSAVLEFNVSSAAAVGGDTLELHQASTSSNKIAGASIAGLTLLGSGLATPTTTGHKRFALSAMPSLTSTSIILLSSGRENTGTAPTGNEAVTVTFADQTGTTNDPFFDFLAGNPWAYVGAGTSVEATATPIILTEPAGVAAGDLMVACLSIRNSAATGFTIPSGWTNVQGLFSGNTATNTSAFSTAQMWYCVRGASPPTLSANLATGTLSVALGRIVAYRNVHQTTPKDTQVGTYTAAAITAVSVTGLTTTADDDLIVALTASGQEGAWSTFNATDPGTSSGTTSSSVLDPIFGQWLERSDVQTVTGNDTSLAIFDGIKQTAGATGNLTATCAQSAGQGVIAGAFKLAPPAPTGTTYNETVAETLAAAEEVAISQFERSGPVAETVASADTVEGLLDATRVVADTAAAAETQAATLVAEKAVVETAAAAETLTGGLAFVDSVAETAAAADTVTKLVSVAGAVAETVAAAETVTGQFDTTKAIAETAAAVDTSAGLLTFTSAIAETATAADTLAGGLAVNVTVAETAAAADTIGKAVSFTSVIAETASAADTAGGLLVRSAAIVETASAAETTVGLLTFTATIAETESAAETITYSVTGAAGTTYNEAQLETLAAVETVVSVGLFVGAITEAASAADTTAKAVSYTKDVAETATAVETVTKTIIFLGAIAETASAAETITYSLIPASVVYNVGVAETASAAETVAATLVTTKAVAEVATAAETITKAVSYTRAVIETASAVDTVGRLVGHDGAIAETALATDTITTTLDATRGVAEIVAAVDSITYTWIVPWRRDPSAWQAWATDTPPAATGWTRAAPPSAIWQTLPQSSVVRVTMESSGGDRIRITEAGAIRIVEAPAVQQWIRDPHLANSWTKE